MQYSSPNDSATVVFSTETDSSGTFVITLKLQDDGGTDNGATDSVITSFTVTVTPVNDAPVITTALSDSSFYEDAPRNFTIMVYDAENDSPGLIAEKVFMHLLKAQMPGSLKQLGRIDYAVTSIDTPLQTGDLGGMFKWGKVGEYDENGQSYELLDEGLGIAGMRAVKLNIPRTLRFKNAEYAANSRKSKSMFTKVALKEGPVDPAEMVDAYIKANESLWRVQKEMNANMDAALLLGTSPEP